MTGTAPTAHGPVTDPAPPLALTDEQRRRFDEDGFFLVEDALTPAEIDELLAVVDARYAAHKRERDLGVDEAFQMRNVTATDPVFLRMVDHPRILPLVVDLMGVNVQLRTSHADVRPPQREEVAAHELGAPDSFFPWHSDGPNFGWPRVQGLLPFMEMKVGYYLTDLTMPNSGEICVVRGSHLSTQPIDTDGGASTRPTSSASTCARVRRWCGARSCCTPCARTCRPKRDAASTTATNPAGCAPPTSTDNPLMSSRAATRFSGNCSASWARD